MINLPQRYEYNTAGDAVLRFSWVTDRDVKPRLGSLYVRGGRSRWRIENETFNTLKNQGYHMEHIYGHGK